MIEADLHGAILDRCLAGDEQAQYQLYQLYAKGMFTVAMRILKNREEAEDVLQEVFVDVFNKLETFKRTSSFGAWLKRIVINRSINVFKKKKLDLVQMESLKGFDPVEDEGFENEPFNYSIEEVQKAIKKLPNGYRIILTLFLLEGYPHKEIASSLGITESTSKSQYNRAKVKLRKILKDG